MGKLDGKVAIVTGAGQRVRRGIALALAKEGAKVVVVGRTAAKCSRTADEIRSLSGTAISVTCNTARREPAIPFIPTAEVISMAFPGPLSCPSEL